MSTINLSVFDAVNNNGGIVMNGGNVNNEQNYLGMTNLSGNYSPDSYPFGSVPVQNLSTTRALVAPTRVFAYNSSRPLIKGVSVTINMGSIDHNLSTPGNKAVSLITGIHSRTTNLNRLDTTAIRNNQYNEYTGKFDEGYPLVVEDFFGSDFAATVSRAETGSMRFVSGLLPVKQNYSPKTA